jgi:hypothetical protein
VEPQQLVLGQAAATDGRLILKDFLDNIVDNIIGEIKPCDQIYRIFRCDYFFQLFENKQNTLVRPEKWSDPWENMVLKARIRTSNWETGRFDFWRDLYGQCWTLHTRSNAIWRLYGSEKYDLRVTTTVGKLLQSLRAGRGNSAAEGIEVRIP